MVSRFKGLSLASLLAGTALSGWAGAAVAETAAPDPAVDQVVQRSSVDQLDEIVVVGSGQTRSISSTNSPRSGLDSTMMRRIRSSGSPAALTPPASKRRSR